MRRLTGFLGAAALSAALVLGTTAPALAGNDHGDRNRSSRGSGNSSHDSHGNGHNRNSSHDSHGNGHKGNSSHHGGHFRDVTVVRAGESIQDAIDEADAGNTVFVKPGTYAEHLVITKTIKLVSWGATLTAPATAAPTPCTAPEPSEDGICIAGAFTASPEGEVTVTDAVEDVVVAGFKIVGFGGSGILQIAGVDSKFVGNAANDNAEYGYAAFSSTGTTMAFNTATGNDEAGFYIGDSHPADARMYANRASDNEFGFFVRNAEDVEIYGNHASGNCAGILLLGDAPGPAGDIDVQWNKVTDNTKACPGLEGPPLSGIGIALVATHDVDVKRNWITGNVASGPTFATGGVVVTVLDPAGTQPSDNTVQKNVIKGNDPDINWDGSGTGNVLEPNRCETSVPPGLCADGV